MRLLNNPIKFNSYLMYLTKGERSLGWFGMLLRHWLYLWIGSSFLIQASVSNQIFWILDAASIVGLPLSVLIIIILLVFSLFIGTQLVVTETQKEQFALLRLTNISPDTIFWSLVLGMIYPARRWLTWIVGGGPFFIWIICFWYMRLAPGNGLTCFVSPLGHTYCYTDGPTYPTRLLEVFWFLSMTIGIFGITTLAILCSVGFTMKSRNAVYSIVGILVLAVPLVLVVILVIAPEGFLLIETEYQWNLIFVRVFFVGIVVAALPFVASLGTQHFLRQRALD